MATRRELRIRQTLTAFRWLESLAPEHPVELLFSRGERHEIGPIVVRRSMDLFAKAGNGIASDPRDLLYGPLALLPASTGIEPDYTTSFAAVRAEATRAVLRYYRCLDYLVHAGLPYTRDKTIPSWAVDLEFRPCSMHRTKIEQFKACLQLGEVSEEQLQDRERLVIHACAIGRESSNVAAYTIDRSTAHNQYGESEDLRHVLLQWRRCVEARSHGQHEAPSSLRFWRTKSMEFMATAQQVVEVEKSVAESTAATLSLAQRLDKWLFGQGDETSDTEMEVILAMAANGAFFDLETGAIGAITKRSAHVGDIVTIAMGSPAPLLLRPVGPEAKDTVYRLVGSCYVDGITQGEALRSAAAEHGLDVENNDLSPMFEHITLV